MKDYLRTCSVEHFVFAARCESTRRHQVGVMTVAVWQLLSILDRPRFWVLSFAPGTQNGDISRLYTCASVAHVAIPCQCAANGWRKLPSRGVALEGKYPL
ncbi:hypothetical protein E2C01_052693 [Portunus trituberculatus]|uniref:Uncharacterized protein n=1 Tax=Portunus trituberculatus TaxID=210409 RepID=A0A5B7GMC7_PORTR|nr:hypothetical protein [Portunus trituberculatus]